MHKQITEAYTCNADEDVVNAGEVAPVVFAPYCDLRAKYLLRVLS